MADGFKILDAYVQVTAKADGVAEDAARQLGSQGSVLSRAGSGLGSHLMGGLQGVIGGLVGGVVSAFAQPLVAGVNDAISAVMDTAKTAIIDYNGKLEQANIGFTTMLGSAEKARSFLDDLQGFAAKTPFEFEDLVTASQRLIAMGVNAKNVIPYMTGIGDAVAGLGGGKELINQVVLALGQMTAKGKVQGDDLMQLTEAGIPALKILADSYGTTTSKMSDMISAGKILSDRAVPAIIKGLEKGTKTTSGFGGMMEKQSKTLAGSMSNIQDAINQTLSKAFLPLFNVVSKGAGVLAKFAGSKAVTNWARDTAKNVDGFMKTIGKGLQDVFGDPKVQRAAATMFSSFSKSVKDAGPPLKTLLPSLIQIGKDLLPVLLENAGKVAGKLPVMAKMVDTAAKAIRDAAPFIKAVIGFLGDLSSTSTDVASAMQDFSKSIYTSIGSMRDAVKAGIDAAVKFIAALPDRAVAAVGDLGGMLQQKGADLIQGFINGVTSKAGELLKQAADLGGQVASAFSKVLQFGSPSRLFKKYGRWIVEGLQNGIFEKVDSVRDASAKVADAVKDLWEDGKFSTKSKNKMLSTIASTTKQLVKQAGLREKIADRLAKANDKLDTLRGDKASLKSSIYGNAMGAGSIGSLFEARTLEQVTNTITNSAAAGSLDGRAYQASYTTSSTSTTTTGSVGGLAGVRQKLRQLVKDTRAFKTNLQKLIQKGLDKFTFGQLIDAGPTVGLPITQELLSDTASFNDIVHLSRELDKASSSLASYGAKETYDNDINLAKDRINSLKRQDSKIEVTMIVEARKIDEVDKVIRTMNALKATAKAAKARKK